MLVTTTIALITVILNGLNIDYNSQLCLRQGTRLVSYNSTDKIESYSCKSITDCSRSLCSLGDNPNVDYVQVYFQYPDAFKRQASPTDIWLPLLFDLVILTTSFLSVVFSCYYNSGVGVNVSIQEDQKMLLADDL
jgi:hypothetical protein